MARVLIYEDTKQDLIERYSSLTGKHEVLVRAGGRTWDIHDDSIPQVFRKGIGDDLRKAGFKLENIAELDLPDERAGKRPEADVYFVDGLDGFCYDILSFLPRDRSFLNTGNIMIRDNARKQGYQILETSPEEAIERVMMFHKPIK